VALGAHDGNDADCQIMDAEHVRFKNFAQRITWKVFDGAGDAKCAIVEQRVKCSTRFGQHLRQSCLIAGRIGVINKRRVEPFGF
jgi:hypothetical protein